MLHDSFVCFNPEARQNFHCNLNIIRQRCHLIRQQMKNIVSDILRTDPVQIPDPPLLTQAILEQTAINERLQELQCEEPKHKNKKKNLI